MAVELIFFCTFSDLISPNSHNRLQKSCVFSPQVSAHLDPKDQEILSYITLIGCSISLFALVITVVIFITNR